MVMGSTGRGRVAVVAAVAAVVVLVAIGGIVGYRHSLRTVAEPATWVPAAAGSSAASSASPSDSPSPSGSPSPSPSPKASPKPTRTKARTTKPTTKPVPSHTKVPAPPPAPPPPPASCTKTYIGTAAPLSQVGAALTTAAGASYHPYIKDVPERTIQVDPVLLKAVAWQESGWQSNVKSCYGAFGAMQVISSTADWMNGNYGTDYDLQTLSGNASLGAEYLAWLVYYFGHFCFEDHYDTTETNPDAPDLRDAVLAAYNLGIGEVDTSDGLVIPNRGYTNAVEGLMVSQPWNS